MVLCKPHHHVPVLGDQKAPVDKEQERIKTILLSNVRRNWPIVSWQTENAFFFNSSAHGKRLLCRSWAPAAYIGQEASSSSSSSCVLKGVVLLVHGVHEHSGRYHSRGHRLAFEGYLVLGHDQLGHGASEGTGGDIVSFDFLVKDLKQLVRLQRQAFPGHPIFLIGHSVGSLVTLQAAGELEAEKPGCIRAVVFSAFAIKLGPGFASSFGLYNRLERHKSLGVAIISLLTKVDPHGGAPRQSLDTSQLTRDRDELYAMAKDPFHHSQGNPLLHRTALEILRAQLAIKKEGHISDFSLPFLALHGSQDQVAYPMGSQILFDASSTAPHDKALKVYPDMRHDVLFELGRQQVEQDIVKFLNDRNPLQNGVLV